jgi:hypothetical protein
MPIEPELINRQAGGAARALVLYAEAPPVRAQRAVAPGQACYLQSPLLCLMNMRVRLQP